MIGLNGSGKTTMLRVLGERQVPVPDHIDIYHLTGFVTEHYKINCFREVEASDVGALDAVLQDLTKEVARLEKRVEELIDDESDDAQEALEDIYARLEELDSETAPTR